MPVATWLGLLTGSALAEAHQRLMQQIRSQARGYLWGDDTTRASVTICQLRRDDQRPLSPFLHSTQGCNDMLPYPMQQSSGATTTCAEALRRKYRPCSDMLRHLKVLKEGRHACAYLHGRNALLRVSQDANIPTCTSFISLTLEFCGTW